jgi:hypothetical protein
MRGALSPRWSSSSTLRRLTSECSVRLVISRPSRHREMATSRCDGLGPLVWYGMVWYGMVWASPGWECVHLPSRPSYLLVVRGDCSFGRSAFPCLPSPPLPSHPISPHLTSSLPTPHPSRVASACVPASAHPTPVPRPHRRSCMCMCMCDAGRRLGRGAKRQISYRCCGSSSVEGSVGRRDALACDRRGGGGGGGGGVSGWGGEGDGLCCCVMGGGDGDGVKYLLVESGLRGELPASGGIHHVTFVTVLVSGKMSALLVGSASTATSIQFKGRCAILGRQRIWLGCNIVVLISLMSSMPKAKYVQSSSRED